MMMSLSSCRGAFIVACIKVLSFHSIAPQSTGSVIAVNSRTPSSWSARVERGRSPFAWPDSLTDAGAPPPGDLQKEGRFRRACALCCRLTRWEGACDHAERVSYAPTCACACLPTNRCGTPPPFSHRVAANSGGLALSSTRVSLLCLRMESRCGARWAERQGANPGVCSSTAWRFVARFVAVGARARPLPLPLPLPLPPPSPWDTVQ